MNGGIAPRRSRRRVLASLALLLTTGAGSALVAAPPTVAAAGTVEALLIGDSVMNGMAQSYGAASRAALAARHSFILDTAGCRRLIAPSCSIPPSPPPTNALTVLRARAGQYSRALVIGAGYNDPSSGSVGMGAAVDTLIAEAHKQGIRNVIWLTYREAGSASNVSRFRASNAVLRAKAAAYPELRLADWAGRSASMPTSWFSGDGIHLGSQATLAMADLIADTLDLLPSVPVIPPRCLTGTWSGTPETMGTAMGGADATGRLQLLDTPVRFVDTRDLPAKLGPGQALRVPVAGLRGVPADASAVVASAIAVEPCGDTFLTLFPCDDGVPLASTVNAVAWSIVANSAVVRLGGGAVCVYSKSATDVVVDVSGWVGPSGLGTTTLPPVRLIDTRPGEPQQLVAPQVRLRAGTQLTVDVSALPGYDASAQAATINVTAVDPARSGFLSVLPGPCGSTTLPPSTSTVNVAAHRNVAASALVRLGAGELCVYTSTDTDVVVDLQALHGPSGGPTTAVDPRRLVDTRDTTRLAAGSTLPVAIDRAADAAIVNLTAVAPSGSGFLTLFECGTPVPTVSNLNVTAGVIVANRAIVPTGGSNEICVYSSVSTDVVVDIEAVVDGA
jgi:hypothetical protein